MAKINPISRRLTKGMRKTGMCVLAAAGAAAVAGEAIAQDTVTRGPDTVARNQTVFERSRPIYDAKGLPIGGGGLKLYPTLDLSETYNDNVYATENNEQDDFETIIEPSVSLQSNWSRHSVALSAFGRIHRFMDLDTENNEEFGAQATGVLNLPQGSSLAAVGGFQRITIDRGDPEQSNIAASSPEQIDQLSGILTYTHNFGRIQATATGQVFDYATVDNADLFAERTEYGAKLRIAYEISAALNAFVEPNYSMRRYDLQTPNRDVDIYGAGFGFSYDITGKLYGETQVGYYTARFDNPAFSNSSGVLVRSEATWNVTALTSIILGIERGNQASNVGTASSSTQSLFDLRLERELARNITAAVTGRYVHETFEGAGRTDDYIQIGWVANYLLNRYSALFLQYQFEDRSSDSPTNEYSSNQITIGIRGQL